MPNGCAGRLRLYTWIAIALVAASAATSVRAGTGTCVGDCNGDGTVSINELITAVNIALDTGSLSTCRAIDNDGDGVAAISELIQAVNGALSSCSRESPLDLAFSELSGGDVIGAEAQFAAAVSAQPNNPQAIFFLALTRLATRTTGDPALLDILGRGRIRLQGGLEDLCAMAVDLPQTVADGAPRTGEIFDTLRASLVPDLQDALDRLENIRADAVISVDLDKLPDCVRPDRSVVVEVDRGDILALRAALLGAQAWAHLLTAYNMDLRIGDLAELPVRMVFEAAPSLLTLRSAEELTAARRAARLSAEALADAIDAIQSETDDQSDDVLVLLPEDDTAAQRLRAGALLFRDALNGEVVVSSNVGLAQPRRLNLKGFFDGRLASLRALVPPFLPNGNPDPRRFPDPTFAGIFADLSQDDIDEILDGGPKCTPCEDNGGCVGLGIAHLACSECSFDCESGATKRCTDPNAYLRCSDGYY
jgi:hypothetical protein